MSTVKARVGAVSLNNTVFLDEQIVFRVGEWMSVAPVANKVEIWKNF